MADNMPQIHRIFSPMCWRACMRFARACDRGRMARRHRSVARRGRAAARCRPMATWRPTPRWCWPRKPRQSRAISPKRSPRELRADDLIASVDVAGPGFINLTLKPIGLGGRAAHGAARGRLPTGEARSARPRRSMSNTSRPTRPGRCMSAIAAARCSAMRWRACLAFAGYDVTREYYINDAGAQVDVLARSAFLRYREALGENIGEIPEGLYPGDYLKPVGAGAGRRARRQAAGDAGSANGCRSCAPRPSR